MQTLAIASTQLYMLSNLFTESVQYIHEILMQNTQPLFDSGSSNSETTTLTQWKMATNIQCNKVISGNSINTGEAYT